MTTLASFPDPGAPAGQVPSRARPSPGRIEVRFWQAPAVLARSA